MKQPNIELILFDLGGVLVNVDTEKALSQAASLLHCTPQKASELWHQMNEDHQQYERGLINTCEWLDQVKKKLCLADKRLVLELFSNIFTLNLPVIKIAQQLSKYYSLALLSNTNPIHFYRIMNDFPELHFFPTAITSFQMHALKPEKEIYLKSCSNLGTLPIRCLFIDDREENVLTAIEVGMCAVQFTTVEKLLDDLQKLSIIIKCMED